MEKIRIHYIESGGRGLYSLQRKNCKGWMHYTNIGRTITPLELMRFEYEVKSKWEIVLSSSAREAIFNQK